MTKLTVFPLRRDLHPPQGGAEGPKRIGWRDLTKTIGLGRSWSKVKSVNA